MEKSWIFAVITIGAFVRVGCLQCYSCADCPASSLTDSELVTCGAVTTTSTTSSSTTTTSTTTSAPITPGNNETGPNPNGTEPGINGTNPKTNGTNTAGSKILQVRRNVQPGCICFGRECACDNVAAVLKTSLYANATFVCAKATVKGQNGTVIITRACAQPYIGNRTVCEFLQTEVIATDCKTCTTEKCNGAHKMQHSMAALLFVLTSIFIANTN